MSWTRSTWTPRDGEVAASFPAVRDQEVFVDGRWKRVMARSSSHLLAEGHTVAIAVKPTTLIRRRRVRPD